LLRAITAQARGAPTSGPPAERVSPRIDQAGATFCGRRCAKVMARNAGK